MERRRQSQRGLARTGEKALSGQQKFSEAGKIVIVVDGGFLPT